MDDEYAKYRCSACKKTIKNQVVTCKSCYQVNHLQLKDTKKASTVAGGGRDRLGSTGTTGSFTTPSSGNRISGASRSSTIDVKIDWLVKVVKEIKDETECKKEIKMMVKEIVREELGNVKQELLEELKRMIQGEVGGSTGRIQRSYSEAVKEKKKENVIIIKPKIQQESEVTKKLIKEKVDIKNMAMGITKLKKRKQGDMIMGCETGEEMKTLKATVQDKLGENFKVTESPQMKLKIKIINVSEEEMRLDDDDLITTIKKQNRIDAINDGFQMRIVKKIVKEKRNDNNQLRRKDKEEDALNAGDTIILQKTVREMKHAKCDHREIIKRLNISDEHDALSPECPTFKRAIQEEKRRAGWEDAK
ncbi:uncharacterized protein PF3D7_1120000-like [Polyergus mexicanus]|uniref:uncharacterized protein PF3D7_1120000-like n=1 Tax=Polyergus mexicanus TaxID=615972 RepID=UPI0038B4C4E1